MGSHRGAGAAVARQEAQLATMFARFDTDEGGLDHAEFTRLVEWCVGAGRMSERAAAEVFEHVEDAENDDDDEIDDAHAFAASLVRSATPLAFPVHCRDYWSAEGVVPEVPLKIQSAMYKEREIRPKAAKEPVVEREIRPSVSKTPVLDVAIEQEPAGSLARGLLGPGPDRIGETDSRGGSGRWLGRFKTTWWWRRPRAATKPGGQRSRGRSIRGPTVRVKLAKSAGSNPNAAASRPVPSRRGRVDRF